MLNPSGAQEVILASEILGDVAAGAGADGKHDIEDYVDNANKGAKGKGMKGGKDMKGKGAKGGKGEDYRDTMMKGKGGGKFVGDAAFDYGDPSEVPLITRTQMN